MLDTYSYKKVPTLCYIKCVNKEKYETYYIGNGNASIDTWKHTLYIISPTFMHIFKAKQLIKNMKILDIKNNEKEKYTYAIVPLYFI